MTQPSISTLVTFRQKRCEFVCSFVTTYRDEVAEALELFFQDEGDTAAPTSDTVAEFLEGLLGRMKGALRNLLEAELKHLDELSGDALPRKRRDEAAAELKQALFDLRALYRAAYGDLIAQEYGFEGRIANDAPALLRQGKRVYDPLAKLVQSPEIELPSPRYEGIVISASAAVAVLEPRIEELREALSEVTREQARIQGTKVAKDRARKRFDHSYRQIVRMLVPAFRLAGHDELAEKIPTSLRRPRRKGTAVVSPVPTS